MQWLLGLFAPKKIQENSSTKIGNFAFNEKNCLLSIDFLFYFFQILEVCIFGSTKILQK